MKLEFLGTRGYIKARTKLHGMHSSCRVSYRGKGVVIDCGEDWLDKLDEMNPRAIAVTHAHPDHVGGLRNGSPCPVFATPATWEVIDNYPISDREMIELRTPVEIRGLEFEAFAVEHSTRAPAVGFRITAGRVSIFYVPDLVYIKERAAALRGTKVYVGDGATIERSMVRRPNETLIGHTPLRTQLTWCRKEEVPRAVFTHCGSEIVTGDERDVLQRVRTLAAERGVEAGIAYDGMGMVIR